MKTLTKFLLCVLCCMPLQAQRIRASFYNVENLFDCRRDSLKDDADFQPDGIYHWTPHRFRQKCYALAKTLVTLGDSDFPSLMALAEAENAWVLHQLLHTARLEESHRVVHFESPDRRGIDVALLYNRFEMKLLSARPIRVIDSDQSFWTTRDLLYARFDWLGDLHVFVCHWPSRYGGVVSSEPRRLCAARILRASVDSLFERNPQARILILGDFNDEPHNKSLRTVLNALPNTTQPIRSNELYNLMWGLQQAAIKTHKYHGRWALFDQVIVSGSLFATTDSTRLNAQVFAPDFLLESDGSYLGKKPFRTYNGRRYQAGYSDHLPVFVDLSP